MTTTKMKFEVRQGKVIDALGRIHEGWIIFEDGRPGYPYKTEEEAIRQMEAIKKIRTASTF